MACLLVENYSKLKKLVYIAIKFKRQEKEGSQGDSSQVDHSKEGKCYIPNSFAESPSEEEVEIGKVRNLVQLHDPERRLNHHTEEEKERALQNDSDEDDNWRQHEGGEEEKKESLSM